MNQKEPSDLPSWARNLLLGVFLLGVLPLAAYGVYTQVVTGREVVPAIQEKLLTPYANALAATEFERAYASFTTASYRRRVDLAAYERAQQANRKAYGEPRALPIHVCNDTREPGRGWFLQCEVRYEGAKGDVPLSLEIVEQEGRYLLDRTYLRETATETRSEMVF